MTAALLFRRKALSLRNAVRSLTSWELGRNAAFLAVGGWMLLGLHYGFHRVLTYLNDIQLIGPLLIWKLTAMALMTTFSMVVISSLIISLTTLFYSFDLPFLMKAPLPVRSVFLEKALESAFFSSWMIALTLAPYLLALGQARGLPWTFYPACAALLLPFLALAAAVGMAFTLGLMVCFPSARTRDAIWLLSSCSLAIVYVFLRVAEPERLARPDMLRLVADYLGYLQAPTAPYLPSWWLARALRGFDGAGTDLPTIASQAALLFGAAFAAYAALLRLAEKTYAAAYSGAQESARSRRSQVIALTPESRLAARFGAAAALPVLLWKDRLAFFRDVRHWSQMALIGALMCVYLFSIQRLPLDTPDVKSLVAFLNLGAAGFVISSLGLRFTFPSISMEGRSFWVIRSGPLGVETLMRQKLLFTLVPMLVVSMGLVLLSNRLLRADPFIAWLSLGTILVMTFTLCGMGVGFGAIFPRFNIPNIHQLESSAGGFVYMAASLFYIGCTLALEAWPVQMHFQERFGRPDAWSRMGLLLCAGGLAALNAAAFGIPWALGRRNLEAYEER